MRGVFFLEMKIYAQLMVKGICNHYMSGLWGMELKSFKENPVFFQKFLLDLLMRMRHNSEGA